MGELPMNFRKIITSIAFIVLLVSISPSAQITYDMTVAKDGSGTHTTVQAAFNAVPQNSAKRTVIYIKNGTYKENLTLATARKNVTVIGQSRDGVKLTYDNYSSKINPATGAEYGTSGSSSTFIDAEGFCSLNVTFENSAGPVGQAVAIRISGDKAVFYNCNFLGRQDTWYGIRCRILVRKCYLEGTTDFMFGASTTWFDSCQIYSYGGTALTAASTEQYVTYGYVFRYCSISGASGVSTVLGRPWRPYSAVSFQYCSMSSCIKAAGWDNWGDVANEATARYSEYKNTGAGATTTARVTWAKQLTDAQAANYTIANVFRTTYADPPVADNWDPLATLNLYEVNSTGTRNLVQKPALPLDFSISRKAGCTVMHLTGIADGAAVSVSIHTLDGRIVYRTKVTGEPVILPGLSKGVYFVRMHSAGGPLGKRIITN
jgi:pectinesterase